MRKIIQNFNIFMMQFINNKCQFNFIFISELGQTAICGQSVHLWPQPKLQNGHSNILANSSIDNQLIKILPGINNSLAEFFDASYPYLVAYTVSSISLQILLSAGFKRAVV